MMRHKWNAAKCDKWSKLEGGRREKKVSKKKALQPIHK